MSNVHYIKTYKQCAQRFREKRRDEYRQLCASFIASSNQVKALEKRIEELVKLLQDNGIAVPHNTTDLVQENISDGADDDAPDNEKIFEEMMQVIDKVDSNETEDD